MYGANIVYTGDTPLKDGEIDESKYKFTHWDPNPAFVTGDMDCYAQFKFTGSFARELIQRTIEGDYVNDRVLSVGDSAFRLARPLTSISLPNAKTISGNAFYGCNGLVELNIPEATTIGGNALRDIGPISKLYLPKVTNCAGLAALTSLTYVELSALGTISYNFFQNDKSLVTVILRNQTLCTAAGNPFNGCFHFLGTVDATYNPNGDKDGYIYVPRVLVDSYKSATNWSAYADQIRAIEDYPEICGGDA
jgi:hypothetical protein